MTDAVQRTVLFHVDLDSPAVLSQFWGMSFTRGSTGLFYETAMNRVLDLFREFEAPATFFCVGEELDANPSAREAIRRAHEAGHEIANHSYSHFFSLNDLSDNDLRQEVKRCSESIHRVTGLAPIGFRAPGYAVTDRLIRTLRELSFAYDSSVFWSPATALMKWYHRMRSKTSIRDSYGESGPLVPNHPYFPAADNWKREGADRSFLEIPLPRSPFYLTPFYNNFHLSLPEFCRVLDVEFSRRKYLVYLFHLIEFCDMNDGFSPALSVHPNLASPVAVKIAKMRDTLRRLRRHYHVMRTDHFVERYRNNTGA